MDINDVRYLEQTPLQYVITGTRDGLTKIINYAETLREATHLIFVYNTGAFIGEGWTLQASKINAGEVLPN